MSLSRLKKRPAIAILFLTVLIAGTVTTAYWFLDLDNDGLPYFEEVNKYCTNPLKADTDGDGLVDGFEVKKLSTDPLKRNPTVRYFIDKGGLMELAKNIGQCDIDGVMDSKEKELVDFLCNPKLDRPTVTQFVRQILEDGGVSEEEASSLRFLAGFPGETQARYADLNQDIINYLTTLASLDDTSFVEYAVRNKLRMEDGIFSQLDRNVLLNCKEYAAECVDADLKELAVEMPDAAAELRKLPDLDPKTVGVREVEANEDIAYSMLKTRNSSAARSNLEKMMAEGFPGKRKFCTPLQALLWYSIDNEPEGSNPLEDPSFRVEDFVENVWRSSSVSDAYRSERWNDLNKVIDRLNSPSLVHIYAWENIKYAWIAPGVPEARRFLQSPLETFKRKLGNCGDQARFVAYCLIRNHYDANYLRVDWGEGTKGAHAVCVYRDKDARIYFLDNTFASSGLKQMVIQGPFDSIRSICERYTVLYTRGKPWLRCYLVPPNADSFDLAIIGRYLYLTNP